MVSCLNSALATWEISLEKEEWYGVENKVGMPNGGRKGQGIRLYGNLRAKGSPPNADLQLGESGRLGFESPLP